ncbi:MAG: AhpC/TSA family protein [Chloroflexota bacterium]
MRQQSQSDNYPPILFVYQGSIDDGQTFFDHAWPEARAVADLPKNLYRAFGLEQGGMREMFGPEVWACGIRATLKGKRVGLPVGDPWMMPGLFYVADDRILWQYDFKHAGDHPNFAALPERLPIVTQ